MSEYSPYKTTQAEAARFVVRLQRCQGAIHSVVARVVELDTNNRNFGRMKDVEFAEEMAYRRNRMYDTSALHDGDLRAFDPYARTFQEFDDYSVDEWAAYVVETEAQRQGTYKEAEKARQDYLITQGYREAIERRRSEIRREMVRRLNPFK